MRLSLTQPRSGAHVGTREHRSLRIRMTMTQERSPLALAWGHKQGRGEGGARGGQASLVKEEDHVGHKAR